LRRFGAEEGEVEERNSTSSGTALASGQPQVRRTTTKKRIDVMPIVPVTAMP
jgi:hypothetical protein